MGDFVFPCPGYAGVSSVFGYRDCPFHGYEFHQGVDLAAAKGTEIISAREGTVLSAGYNGDYGNTILIDHGNGVQTRYAHAHELFVSNGDAVLPGQEIGSVGSTGQTTGDHLHFEIIIDGICKNPFDYVIRKDTLAAFYGMKEQEKHYYGLMTSDKNEITRTSVKETYNSVGKHKFTQLSEADAMDPYGYSVMIENDKIYMPTVTSELSFTSERNNPGCLKFTVLKSEGLSFTEGNPVCFQLKGKNIFYGYIFSKSRQDKNVINITAYDQLRYLKNKDTFIYSDKKYSELIGMIANEFGLNCGEITDTKYLIPARAEEGTILDMLYNAADLTYENTGDLFILYDNCGKICLKNSNDMITDILITEKTASRFSYTSTIDNGVFNRVKLAFDNKAMGEREIYVFNGQENQAEWGILQHYERLPDITELDIKAMGETLLSKLNRKKRILSIQGCFGDLRVRGGSRVCVKLNIGDLFINNFVTVERVTHKFSNGKHFMDLECELT